MSGTADTQGVNTHANVELAFRVAEETGDVKLAFHLEPYPGRTAFSVKEDVEYLIDIFGDSPALERSEDGRPVFYVYDSYHILPEDWRKVFDLLSQSPMYAGYFIALWLNAGSGEEALRGGFHGTYTYFAANSFSYGSTLKNWPQMKRWSEEHNMSFIPSVAPGYDDTKIRPWNSANLKPREGGQYFKRMWEAATDAGSRVISITSYNEWGEGTQIESARADCGSVYKTYEPMSPHYYIEETALWSDRLSKMWHAEQNNEL